MKSKSNLTNPRVIANVIVGYYGNEYTRKDIEVEVLTVHFNTGTMRVRYKASIHSDTLETRTEDISNKAFLDAYNITLK